MRVNARLDSESEKALMFIQQNTGDSLTEIIKHALGLYCQELQTVATQQNQLLLDELAGIWQSSDGDSSHYKEDIRNYVDEKYRHC